MDLESKKRGISEIASPTSPIDTVKVSKSQKLSGVSPVSHCDKPSHAEPYRSTYTIVLDDHGSPQQVNRASYLTSVNMYEEEGCTASVNSLLQAFKDFECSIKQDLKKLDKIDQLVQDTDKLKKDFDNFAVSVKHQDLLISELKDEVTQCREKMSDLEFHNKKKNLLIDGIHEAGDKSETEQDLVTKLQVIFKIMADSEDSNVFRYDNVKLEAIHRLGTVGKKTSMKPRTVIVRFDKQSDRHQIWSKRFALKGTGYWVNEHLPMSMENDRQVLKSYFNAALAAKLKPRFIKNKLHIKDKIYGVNDIAELPDQIGPKKLFSVPNANGIIQISGTSNPLSNAFPSTMYIEGLSFTSVDQFVYFRKAEVVGDSNAAKAILNSKTQTSLYKVANQLDDCIDWNTIRETVMSVALHCKFEQNDLAAGCLISTGSCTLAYVNKDPVWGTGQKPDKSEAFGSTWSGKNMVGHLLMKVREELIE